MLPLAGATPAVWVEVALLLDLATRERKASATGTPTRAWLRAR